MQIKSFSQTKRRPVGIDIDPILHCELGNIFKSFPDKTNVDIVPNDFYRLDIFTYNKLNDLYKVYFDRIIFNLCKMFLYNIQTKF